MQSYQDPDETLSRVGARSSKKPDSNSTPSSGNKEEPSHHSFSSLGISPLLIRSLASLSIKVPTKIQSATIPSILSGRDLIGGAQTGSGKTLCFALPILNALLKDMVGGFAIVLTPTRELGVQLHEQFVAVGEGARMGLRCALVLGGMDMMKQAAELAGMRPHVIVATPGRLVDHLRSGGGHEWGLTRCRFLVLDEADRLLTPTFEPELSFLKTVLPPPSQLQTLLFTATLTPEVEAIGQQPPPPGRKPTMVCKIEQDTKTPKTLTQRYIFVPSHVREPYLYHLLNHSPIKPAFKVKRNLTWREKEKLEQLKKKRKKSNQGGGGGGGRNIFKDDTDDEMEEKEEYRFYPTTIIFASRCKTAASLSRMLTELEIPNVSLHSHLSQPQRLKNLETFRSQSVPILISTDVGSRGLDIPEVQMVVNWDLPLSWQDYVHRVGRTARNNKLGWAVSFVTERDVDLVQGIEEKINVRMEELEMDEEAVLEKLNQVSTAKRVATMALHDEGFGERQERNKKKALMSIEKEKSKSSGDGKRKKQKQMK
ncbi:DEAD-domain-containing protein [Violaceomyces palustris]|uniref:DEAD-domain-containing protein n=1 Tax=Violaceomyces palustris TaxID=1673888 RepID=A0ACD0P2J6_9BASI|nr:DEAD-domain-containing protein [Violaceomyces palustris]